MIGRSQEAASDTGLPVLVGEVALGELNCSGLPRIQTADAEDVELE